MTSNLEELAKKLKVYTLFRISIIVVGLWVRRSKLGSGSLDSMSF